MGKCNEVVGMRKNNLQFKEVRDRKGNLRCISLVLSKGNIFDIFEEVMKRDITCKKLAVCFSKRKDGSLKVVV